MKSAASVRWLAEKNMGGQIAPQRPARQTSTSATFGELGLKCKGVISGLSFPLTLLHPLFCSD